MQEVREADIAATKEAENVKKELAGVKAQQQLQLANERDEGNG
jgi:hypothetical protein